MVVEQEIRFADLDGRRIAYATVGEGPLLVFGAPYVSHVEAEWARPDARALYEELARDHRVVRYDRLGVGLSDRELGGPPTLESAAATLETVLDALGAEPATVFASSCAPLAAAVLATRRPERLRKLVFFGGYAHRPEIPEATRRSLVDFAATNWPLMAQMLCGLQHPRGSGDEIASLSRYLRSCAEPAVAAAYLELDLTADLRPFLPHVTTPALVVHRRGDRVVSIARGRELAALLPNARFVPLAGDAHVAWLGDTRELRRTLAGFLGDEVGAPAAADSPLSSRETEVLRLVASGLSNREIAASLVLSEHTVHRHLANVLRKLAQSSRAAAAAHATRAGLI